jgi:hypothetical protein
MSFSFPSVFTKTEIVIFRSPADFFVVKKLPYRADLPLAESTAGHLLQKNGCRRMGGNLFTNLHRKKGRAKRIMIM